MSDSYFRGYDQKNADFWLFKEWERVFDAYVQYGNLPNLQQVRFAHDHFGDFTSASDGVDTPDKQMADNDYAVGLLVEKVSKSPYKDSTLIFVIEDDAQDGGDHVDAHRRVAYIVGPYVKQEAVVSRAYNTVSMIRTIEDVLGLEALGLTDGLAAPMTEVFEETLRPWTYTALVPEVLRTTELPLPPRTASNSLPLTDFVLELAKPRHDAAYWQQAMGWQNFKAEDRLDPKRFNGALWHGLMGQDAPYPEWRHGRDLSHGRELLLQTYRQKASCGRLRPGQKTTLPNSTSGKVEPARWGLGAWPMVFSALHPSASSYNSAGPKAHTDSWQTSTVSSAQHVAKPVKPL